MSNHKHNDRHTDYSKNSLTLWGAVSMGTGVMIGAGIFALTGQVAELAREWFPLAFLVAAVVAGFSAYSYVRMATTWPSAGGIAMFLVIGVVMTIVFEALATGPLQRWEYNELMPTLPILGTGVAPLLQWLLIPPLVLWIVRRQIQARISRDI